MGLSGSRLTGTLAADYLTQLQALFPVNASLLAAEKTAYATAQQNIATAFANAGGPDVVNEISGHAVVTVTGVSSGVSTAPGTVA